MATIVLVPGATCGGWCWRRVAPLLRQAGHEVFTPTLTGLGERVHLATPEVNLTTHIQDIVNVLDYEELTGVVLVGHSYGGIIISGVAERSDARLAHLVYLDARVPRNGESMKDGFDEARWAMFMAGVRGAGDGWRVPLPDMGPQPWGMTDPEDVRWVLSKVTPQPLATWTEPVWLSNPRAAAVRRTYIFCQDNPWSRGQADQVRNEPGWQFLELPTGHMAMVTAPREVADLLLGIAESVEK